MLNVLYILFLDDDIIFMSGDEDEPIYTLPKGQALNSCVNKLKYQRNGSEKKSNQHISSKFPYNDFNCRDPQYQKLIHDRTLHYSDSEFLSL